MLNLESKIISEEIMISGTVCANTDGCTSLCIQEMKGKKKKKETSIDTRREKSEPNVESDKLIDDKNFFVECNAPKEMKGKKKKKETSIDERREKSEPNVEFCKLIDNKNYIVECNAQKEICLFIYYTFKGQGDLERKHYKIDIKRVNEFITKIGGFRMKLLPDQPRHLLTENINKIVVDKNHKKIIIILMTHGINSNILLGESEISSTEFFGMFKKIFDLKSLKKIFFLCYCQGNKMMLSETSYPDITYPHQDLRNTFVGYSQSPGYSSLAGDGGDVYLQILIDIIIEKVKKKEYTELVQVQKECEETLKTIELLYDEIILKQIPWHYTSLEQDCILYGEEYKTNETVLGSISINDEILFGKNKVSN